MGPLAGAVLDGGGSRVQKLPGQVRQRAGGTLVTARSAKAVS